MRALEEFLVTVDNFEYNTIGCAEKIELSEESSMTFKPKGSARLTGSSDALWGNGLRCGEQYGFALLQSFKRIWRLGEELVLFFHSYQTYFRQPLPFWEIFKKLAEVNTGAGGKVIFLVWATSTCKS
jgi:hypothetical protein